jgi:hypothetical protein
MAQSIGLLVEFQLREAVSLESVAKDIETTAQTPETQPLSTETD